MDSGIEGTFRKFTDDTKLCCVEGRDATLRGLDRLKRHACANLVRCNKAKCKVLHLGWDNPKHEYRLGREWIVSSPEEESRVLVDKKLSTSLCCLIVLGGSYCS